MMSCFNNAELSYNDIGLIVTGLLFLYPLYLYVRYMVIPLVRELNKLK